MIIEILLKQVRKEKGLSIEELSKRSNVSIAHISDIENKNKKPGFIVMLKFAKALKVDINDLYKIHL